MQGAGGGDTERRAHPRKGGETPLPVGREGVVKMRKGEVRFEGGGERNTG